MQKIIIVAGARPNFMKIAPVLRVFKNGYSGSIKPILVHTGQHYDDNMSGSFFAHLGIAKPDYNLNVGSGTHADQTAKIMTAFEDVCEMEQPSVVIVVGDVNSTVAAGLVAKKLHIQLAHIEAGLRSGDRTMPEEINRLATDAITDHFFVTENHGVENLRREGHPEKSIHFVGHVMIDNLLYQKDKLSKTGPSKKAIELKDNLSEQYACLTLHRPANVDSPQVLSALVQTLLDVAKRLPILFPAHPRTLSKLSDFGLLEQLERNIIITEPLGYNDFLYLWKNAVLMLTDSGGLQEETTALGIPCLTLRENTERPVTINVGSNTLVGIDHSLILSELEKILNGVYKQGSVPELWDGRAGERICSILTGAIK